MVEEQLISTPSSYGSQAPGQTYSDAHDSRSDEVCPANYAWPAGPLLHALIHCTVVASSWGSDSRLSQLA